MTVAALDLCSGADLRFFLEFTEADGTRHREPLAACVLDGSATVAERKFVVDRFRRSFKSDLRPRGEAEKEARDRKIAARMLQRSGSKVVSVVAEEFGVKPRTVWAAKKKHGHKGLIKP